MRDYLNHIHTVRAVAPAAAVADNTPWVSQIIDVAGFEGLVFLILLGALADADVTFAVTMEHGNDSGLADTSAVPASQITGSLALAGFRFDDDNETRKVGYVGSKRYVRLTITPANNGGNAFVAVVAALFGARNKPTANPPQ